MAEPLQLDNIIRTVWQKHPDIPLADINALVIGNEASRLDAQLESIYTASGGYSDERTRATNAFSSNGARTWNFDGNIQKPLKSGDSIGLNLSYNSKRLTYPSTALFQADPNPAYRNQIDVSWRHPFLKGAGRPEYHEQRSAIQADVQSAALLAETTKEQLAINTILAFFDFASATTRLDIAEHGIQRARRLLRYQKKRADMGLIEKADSLQAKALLEARITDHTQISAELAQHQTTLNRLMQKDPDDQIDISMPTFDTEKTSLQNAVALAEKNRPVFQSLKQDILAADARIRAAQDKKRIGLDLVASLGSRALEGTAEQAVLSGSSLNDRFAFLGLELSGRTGNQDAKTDIRKNELEKQRAMLTHLQTLSQITDDIASLLTSIRSTTSLFHQTGKQATAEQAKYRAELARYREGRSDTSTLIQFESDLQAARLNQALQEIELDRLQSQLDWATGKLMQRLGQQHE